LGKKEKVSLDWSERQTFGRLISTKAGVPSVALLQEGRKGGFFKTEARAPLCMKETERGERRNFNKCGKITCPLGQSVGGLMVCRGGDGPVEETSALGR